MSAGALDGAERLEGWGDELRWRGGSCLRARAAWEDDSRRAAGERELCGEPDSLRGGAPAKRGEVDAPGDAERRIEVSRVGRSPCPTVLFSRRAIVISWK